MERKTYNDLNQLRDSLEQGWVVPQIPIRESISVSQLGDYPVLDARWMHNKESYYEYIVGIVQHYSTKMILIPPNSGKLKS